VLASGAIARIDAGQTIAVIHVLIDAVNSDDAPLQGAAADELGLLGKHAEPALPALFGRCPRYSRLWRLWSGAIVWNRV
jgi:hypothetical protein